jgi:hypothetical protein
VKLRAFRGEFPFYFPSGPLSATILVSKERRGHRVIIAGGKMRKSGLLKRIGLAIGMFVAEVIV